jgi:hypothetical protein
MTKIKGGFIMRAVGPTEIMIIRPIDTTNKGPMVPDGTGGWQPVHLKQGEMDGACGLYSLMMGLIICGVVRYDEARSFHAVSSKSKLGKLLDFFRDRGPLISGIDLDQMFNAVDKYSPGPIDCQGFMRKAYGAPALVEFIERNIIENHPVLLLITFEGGGHWVLVIGGEYKKTKLCRFLILDPEENTPQICSWNGVIDVKKQKGTYQFHWWRTKNIHEDINNIKVQLEYAIAIWPKKNKKTVGST